MVQGTWFKVVVSWGDGEQPFNHLLLFSIVSCGFNVSTWGDIFDGGGFACYAIEQNFGRWKLWRALGC